MAHQSSQPGADALNQHVIISPGISKGRPHCAGGPSCPIPCVSLRLIHQARKLVPQSCGLIAYKSPAALAPIRICQIHDTSTSCETRSRNFYNAHDIFSCHHSVTLLTVTHNAFLSLISRAFSCHPRRLPANGPRTNSGPASRLLPGCQFLRTDASLLARLRVAFRSATPPSPFGSA